MADEIKMSESPYPINQSNPSMPQHTSAFGGRKDEIPDLSTPLPGWPSVAKWIAQYPSFAAFQDLRAKSLLYYQAELELLRGELHATEFDDFRTGEARGIKRASTFGRNLATLIASRDYEDPELRKQWTLITQIRNVLKEYDDTLLRFCQISALDEADSQRVAFIKSILQADSGGRPCFGPGSHTWGDLRRRGPEKKSFRQWFSSVFWWSKSGTEESEEEGNIDLIAPDSKNKVDGITKWVIHDFLPLYLSLLRWNWFPKFRNHSRAEPAAEEDDATLKITSYNMRPVIGAILYSTNTISACLLPIIAIVVLANLHTKAQLLGTISAFTAVFALVLTVFTQASRPEIFTATAAFTAVMVVFIQGAGSNGT